MRGYGRIPCVPIFQISLGQKIDVVEYEYVVFGWMFRRSSESIVESDVEKFASVEFPLVVGLFDDVDVIVLDFVLGLEVGEELFHVGCEFGEVFGSLLGGVEVSVGDYDGYGISGGGVAVGVGVVGFERFGGARRRGL